MLFMSLQVKAPQFTDSSWRPEWAGSADPGAGRAAWHPAVAYRHSRWQFVSVAAGFQLGMLLLLPLLSKCRVSGTIAQQPSRGRPQSVSVLDAVAVHRKPRLEQTEGAGLPDSSKHAKAKKAAGECLMSPAAREKNENGLRSSPRSFRGGIAARS